MITTKKQLIKLIDKIGNQKIEQGILFRELANSINHNQKSKTFKEWVKLVNHKTDLIQAKEVLK